MVCPDARAAVADQPADRPVRALVVGDRGRWRWRSRPRSAPRDSAGPGRGQDLGRVSAVRARVAPAPRTSLRGRRRGRRPAARVRRRPWRRRSPPGTCWPRRWPVLLAPIALTAAGAAGGRAPVRLTSRSATCPASARGRGALARNSARDRHRGHDCTAAAALATADHRGEPAEQPARRLPHGGRSPGRRPGGGVEPRCSGSA